MHEEVLIDGVAVAGDWLNERAFQFGDGLFETIAVVDGQPCLWDLHCERLALGCQRLRLPLPNFERFKAEARRLCSGRALAALKLYWTAGRSVRGYLRPASVRPQRLLRVFDWAGAVAGAIWTVRQCNHRLSDNPALAQIKHLNRLDQVLARAEWEDPAIDEGLMLDQSGNVSCGTMSNLFVQSGDALRTPVIARAGVAGVVRRLALEIARRHGFPVQESFLSPEELHRADAVYLTNSLIGVVRVGCIDSTSYDTSLGEHPLMEHTRRQCHHPGVKVRADE